MNPQDPNQQQYQQPAPPPQQYYQPYQSQDDTMQKFIPTKNMPSLWAYYMGVFGLIPFVGLPLSIAAIVLGFMGLKKFKATPTPGAKGHALAGLILGIFEITVFVLFLGLILLGSMSN